MITLMAYNNDSLTIGDELEFKSGQEEYHLFATVIVQKDIDPPLEGKLIPVKIKIIHSKGKRKNKTVGEMCIAGIPELFKK